MALPRPHCSTRCPLHCHRGADHTCKTQHALSLGSIKTKPCISRSSDPSVAKLLPFLPSQRNGNSHLLLTMCDRWPHSDVAMVATESWSMEGSSWATSSRSCVHVLVRIENAQLGDYSLTHFEVDDLYFSQKTTIFLGITIWGYIYL
jgi:hypothetical protein